jgi:hypothetical protein
MEAEPPVKVIDVVQAGLDRCDAGVVREICDGAEGDPEMVRMFQGSIGFRFPEQKQRGEDPWNNPSVQAWGREAYAQAPHLLYYLHPEPGFGALALVLCSFFEPEEVAMGMTGQIDVGVRTKLLSGISEHLTAAALFGQKVADPWEPIVECLLAPFDKNVSEEITDLVAASLVPSPSV